VENSSGVCLTRWIPVRERASYAGGFRRTSCRFEVNTLAAPMPDSLLIQTVSDPIRGSIRPPGSKSLTNRALIVSALAAGETLLSGVLDSGDTRVMIDSLGRLGIEVTHDVAAKTARIVGCAGRLPAQSADLWLENSGTSIRFLTAMASLGHGQFRLDGNDRMRERPIEDLVEALKQLDADVACELDTGCPPVVVTADGLNGGTAKISGSVSSQYLSALLMAAPGSKSGVDLQLTGELVSQPYIDMTMGVMARFGVAVDTTTTGCYQVAPQCYQATEYDIEPDATAASYFFAAAAVTGGEVTVNGLSQYSLQGDIGFLEALEKMGCRIDWKSDSVTVHGGELNGIDIDMNAISDTAQTLAAVAVFANGPTTIRNVDHMRHKETDRIEAIRVELERIGIAVDVSGDGFTVHPGPVRPATIKTYDDHRMAMSFAIVGLKCPGIQIADPGCTAKTYPHFFDDLQTLCRSND
jgi:3-phosphoshikimate 1-carboxyvinyltransferase